MSKPPVVIVPYDPRWPRMFEAEADLIRRQVGPHLDSLDHIGSTAVPGLAAKPIIDIMPGLRRLSDAQACIEPLASIRYEYVPEYEKTLPERRYFRKGPPEGRTHHLHMVESKSDFSGRYLLFRDFLRSHPDVAGEYERLKRRLAKDHRTNREAYTEGKSTFVKAVIARARADQTRRRGRAQTL